MSRAAVRALLAMALVAGPAPVAAQRAVELELVLALDTSASIDNEEFALQIEGVAQAFRDPGVQSAIRSTGPGGIAVAVVQWGVGLQQAVVVDWTWVHDRTSAEALAQEIETRPRRFRANGTGITRALAFAGGLFDGNGFSGRRRVIDLSADGRNNSGASPQGVRDRLAAEGVVINGLAIEDGDVLLTRYFENSVIGGTAAFVVTARDFRDFADAIKVKLRREIRAPISRFQRVRDGAG